jgi:hypothetical protein
VIVVQPIVAVLKIDEKMPKGGLSVANPPIVAVQSAVMRPSVVKIKTVAQVRGANSGS